MIHVLLLLLTLDPGAASTCTPPRVFNPSGIAAPDDVPRHKQYYDAFSYLCKPVKRSCLDQGALVLHEAKDGDEFSQPHPPVNLDHIKEAFRHADLGGGLPVWGMENIPAQLPTRYATTEEAASAHFSKCTTPIVFFQHWLTFNIGEFAARTAAWLYWWTRASAQPRAVLPSNMTIVLAAPANLPLATFHRVLLRVFSRLEVTSLASFSARRDSQTPSKSTWEGRHVRCFEEMYICNPDRIVEGLYATGQLAVQYFKPSLPKNVATSFWGNQSSSTHLANKILRVLFEQRTGISGTRRLMNLQQLVEACNTRRWPPLNGSYQGLKGRAAGTAQQPLYDGVVCRMHTFGLDLLHDMAIMQSTDVYVTLHGAGEMNALFLRPGSALVELRPYELGTKYKYQHWQILCWFVNLDEPDSWQPGVYEHARVKHSAAENLMFASRDRNTILRMRELEYTLQRIVALHIQAKGSGNSTSQLYAHAWDARQVAWTFANGTVLSHNHTVQF